MNAEPARPARRFSWPAAFAAFAFISALLIGLVFWRIETWPARTAHQTTVELEHIAGEVRDAFVQMAQLQPRITINNRTYVERTTSIAELAILARQIEVEHEMLHTWAGSTKRVKLHGTFAARAGFDLQNDVSVNRGDTGILITLPHAKLLGLEQKQVEVLAFENGFWNRISAADVQTELGQLADLARAQAAESGLAAEADRAIERQLAERVKSREPLRVTFRAALAKP